MSKIATLSKLIFAFTVNLNIIYIGDFQIGAVYLLPLGDYSLIFANFYHRYYIILIINLNVIIKIQNL